MKSQVFHFIFLLAMLNGLGPQAFASTSETKSQKAHVCAPRLQATLDSILERPELSRARVGVLVQPLASSAAAPLYTREGQQFFLPASTTKILTTAAALTALGPQHRLTTQMYGTGQAPTLDTLRVVGQGDPSFSEKQLRQMARHLKRQGIHHIQHLVGDDSTFLGATVVPSWEWEDLQGGWGSPVNSLMVNENAYEVRMYPQKLGEPLRLEWQLHPPRMPWKLINRTRTVASSEPQFTEIVRRMRGDILEVEVFGQLHEGGKSDRSWMAIIDPGWYFLRRLQDHLAREGISVSQVSLVIEADQLTEKIGDLAAETLLISIESPPLSDLVYTINQYSNNLFAEAVLKALGNARREAQPANLNNTPTLEQGLAVLKQTLTTLGVDPQTYDISDGSGLSRHNLISPEALIQTLQLMATSPHADVFIRSLRARSLGGTSEQPGVIQAKSGGMTGFSNLAGYVGNAETSQLTFSIFVNQYNQPRHTLRGIYDQMLTALTQSQDC